MKKIIKTVFLISFISVLTRVVSFLFRIYLSRLIGAEALGIYQVAMSIVSLIATFTAGISVTLSRKTAESRQMNMLTEEASLLSSSITLSLCITLVITCLILIFRPVLGFIFSDNRCIPLFYMLLPCVITTDIISCTRSWFWGQKRYFLFSITELVECIIRITLGLLLISNIVFNLNALSSTAISFTMSDIINTIIMIVVFFSFGGKLAKPKHIKEVFNSSTPITATRLFTSLVQSLMAIVLPAVMINVGFSQEIAMSEYGRLMGMTIPLLYAPAALTGSIAVVLVPEIASDRVAGNTKSLNTKIEDSINISILFSAIFFVLFVPLGKEIGTLIYNDELSGTYLTISAIIMLPLNLNQITGTLLNSMAKEKETLKHYLIGAVALILSIVILPRYIGILSLTCGMGLCFSITAILNLISIHKETSIKLNYLITIAFFIIGGGLSIYGSIIIKSLLSTTTFISTIITAIISLGIFIVLCIIMGYDKLITKNKALK